MVRVHSTGQNIKKVKRDLKHAHVTQWDDIYMDDWPDMCDAYAVEAEWGDGTLLTEEELEALNDDDMLLREKLENYLF